MSYTNNNNNLHNNNMNIDNNISNQHTISGIPTTTSSSTTTHTAAPFSSQSHHLHQQNIGTQPTTGTGLKDDSNDLSKPSFFKNTTATAASSAASLASSSASSLLSSEMGSQMSSSSSMSSGVVRDPLSLANIEERGGLHAGLPGSTSATSAVMSTLKAKENDVLLGAAKKINELEQKEHNARTNLHANNNMANNTMVNNNTMADNHHSNVTSTSSQEPKIHKIAVDAKQKLDEVRMTENKVVQNLSAADQLRAMAHEREVIAEKQNADSVVAQSAANALHPTKLSSSSHSASSTHTAPSTSSSTSSMSNKIGQQDRPIVQQTTSSSTTTHGTGLTGDKYTRGA